MRDVSDPRRSQLAHCCVLGAAALTPRNADGETSLAQHVDTRSWAQGWGEASRRPEPYSTVAEGGLRPRAGRGVSTALATGVTRQGQALGPSPLCSRASRSFENHMFSDVSQIDTVS